MKEQKKGLPDPLAARRYIRDFAGQLSERTGLPARELEKDIIRVKRISHISLDEYEWTGCYALSDAQKKTVSTLWTRAQFRKTFTDRRYICLLMNKFIFSRVFAEYMGRRCARLTGIDAEALRRLAGDTGKVVLKPLCKGQGQGVRVFDVSDPAGMEAALDYARQLADGVAEEFIVQHPVMAALNPAAVNIVRFYSVFSPVGSYLFAPVLTVADGMDISNGSQDALTAMADIRSGVVLTDAVDQNNIVDYPAHPLSGAVFKGTQIPFWEETLALMRELVPLAGKISNVGWDIALTEKGPLLIEANTIPGFNTAQYRGFGWVTDGYGYQPLFDEGMTGRPFPREYYEKVLLKLS